MLTLLFGLAGVVFLFAFIVHGFMFPQSKTLTLVMKIVCPLSLAPALGYKAYTDYATFRSSKKTPDEQGANRRSSQSD